MHQDDALSDRLAAVERALTGGDASIGGPEDGAALDARIEVLEERLEALEARLDETDAAVTAVRGYVGEVRHVNDEVERTAQAALAAVERLDGERVTPALATVDPPDRSADPSTAASESRPAAGRSSPNVESGNGPLRTVLDWLGDLA